MTSFSLKRAWAIFFKEFVQLRRDRISAGLIVGVPLMQLLLFGYAINNDPHHLPAAVMTHDTGQLARAVVSALERTTYLNVVHFPKNGEAMDALLRQGKVTLAVTIPHDFTRRVMKRENPVILVEADASDPTAAASAISAVMGLPEYALMHDLRESLRGDATFDSSLLASMTGAGGPPFSIVLHRLFNPENVTAFHIVPGLLGTILTLTLVMMTAMAVTRENERGTMEFLLATPLRPMEIMAGKLLPYVFVGIVQVGLILFAGATLFSVPMAGTLAGWVALSLGAFLFILCNLCLGYLISTVAKNQLQAMQMSFFYLMPSIFLTGFAFPFYGMPGWAQTLGEALPTTHFLRIVRGALLKSQTLADTAPELLALGLIVLLISAGAVARSRTTLD